MQPVNAQRILIEVCGETGVKFGQMRSKYRNRDVVMARHIAWVLLSALTDMNTMEMGALFNRDHSTVVLARQRFIGYLETEASTVELVWRIVERLGIELQ